MPKRFVPAKLHGLLDFLTVGLFITGGEILRVRDQKAKTPSQVMGAAVAVYSVFTDYGSERPFGGVRLLSMKQHLQLDLAFGLWVGLSPWVSGTWRNGWNYWAPQTFAMTSEVFFALTTELDPG